MQRKFVRNVAKDVSVGKDDRNKTKDVIVEKEAYDFKDLQWWGKW